MSDLRKFFAKELDEEIQKVRDEYEKEISILNAEISRLKNYTSVIRPTGVTGSVGPVGVSPSQIMNAKYNWGV